MSTRPTLASVAERTGLSRQTISNVLNAPDRVRPETRDKVERAIAALGYRPNTAARQLRTRRSMALGLRLMPRQDGINGSIFDRFVHALTEHADLAGYRIVLFTASDDDAEVAAYDELLETADLDGFVLTSTHHGDQRTRWLLDHGTPFVTFGRPWSDQVDPHDSIHRWVDVDGRRGTAAAVAHLRERGHERIGFLGWPAGSGAGDERRAGWSAAAGDDRLDVETTDGVAQGAAGAAHLIAAGATALVCASDSLALGASRHTDEVIGFDDTPVAAAVGMSSVAQPVEEAAAHVVAMLAQVLGDHPSTDLPDVDRPHVLLEPRLVLRDPVTATTAAPVTPRGADR